MIDRSFMGELLCTRRDLVEIGELDTASRQRSTVDASHV